MRVGMPHHLVPCKSNINTLRRNAPFGEIPDDKTKYWILDDKVFIRPDKGYLDNYSESASGFFEPREALKGDIARSLFYFFTVYGHNMTKKNRSFFTSMLPDLCRWHRADKVDSTEYKKSIAISRIQSNVNPFIFDPSLAERCYCAAYPTIPEKSYSVNIYPNPSKGLFYIDIPEYKGPVIMKISNQSGKLLETHHLMYSGLMSWRLEKGGYSINIELYNHQIIIQTVLIN